MTTEPLITGAEHTPAQGSARKVVQYKVARELATISSTATTRKAVRLVSWSGRPEKLDLRTWRDADGEEAPGKGITLTPDEARRLRDALTKYLEEVDHGVN